MFAKKDPSEFQNHNSLRIQNDQYSDLVKGLLTEIIRVKRLIKNINAVTNSTDNPGSNILNELVSEAYQSLTNYDVVLMKKYYDLLLNCD